MTPMVYYISWSSQCVVGWFPGGEDVSQLCLPADKGADHLGCTLLHWFTRMWVTGTKRLWVFVFESSGSCVCHMTLTFSAYVWIILIQFDISFINFLYFHAKPFMILVFWGTYGNFLWPYLLSFCLFRLFEGYFIIY